MGKLDRLKQLAQHLPLSAGNQGNHHVAQMIRGSPLGLA